MLGHCSVWPGWIKFSGVIQSCFTKLFYIFHYNSNLAVLTKVWPIGIACWIEHWTCDWKAASSNPGRSGRRIFFSSQLCVLTLIRCPFCPMLPQWHVKDHSHSAKSAGGRLHLNTHTPMNHRSQSGLTMLPFRKSVGIYYETSSHTTRQGTHGNSCLSLLSHCGLILVERVELACVSLSPLKNLKKERKKKHRQEMNCPTFSQNLHTREKATTTTTTTTTHWTGTHLYC